MLKMFLENLADRPNVMYRIIVFRYNVYADIAPTNLSDQFFWSGTDGAAGNMNRMLDRPNGDRIKVIKDQYILPTNQANYTIQTGGPAP